MIKESKTDTGVEEMQFEQFRAEVLRDYRIACESRQASLLGRKEVLTGKAKFGIFGDGKEVAQLAMAKVFRHGDFRSGYYRDQTFMFAIEEFTVKQFFAQLYAHPSIEFEPTSAGRSMNGHFGTRSLNADGSWKSLTSMYNSSADVSPTGSQMPRLLGLALASKLYRKNKELNQYTDFSINGNEVAFGTIGDASTSEGMFFETINAAGVLQVPMAVSVWDDGYGISVPSKYQTTKQSISEVLKGFEATSEKPGFIIYTCKGWDYAGLCEMYEKGIAICREKHVPVLFHIQEMTQPQGHSTSGSHERYKSKERLAWEEEFDCIRKMREWITSTGISNEEELNNIDVEAKKFVTESRKKSWDEFNESIKSELNEIIHILGTQSSESANGPFLQKIADDLSHVIDPSRKDIIAAVKHAIAMIAGEETALKKNLLSWYEKSVTENAERYNSYLYSQSEWSAMKVTGIPAVYNQDSAFVDGRELLRENFDYIFEHDPLVVAFGEDLGFIGDVNQGFAGLQQKYGELRITDTGIRECTIVGQGIGLATRGLRPIAEIQYLDYLLYALQILSDDLATLHYRTKGGQKAPVIIRTRGHRLEGIWHSGSPLGMIINALRGIYILVPRNMTQAAGFYNTMLASDDPALIIEPLNGYRLKEQLPANIGDYRIALGIPEILNEGSDVTLVTYGSCCRIAMEAVKRLETKGISCELIDVQTLLPFDINHLICKSLQKTNKIVFMDEDVPGGASAFMMQKVLEEQGGYAFLDAAPKTLTAKEHRPAYGTDGDYFSNPNAEDVFDVVYNMMSEYNPGQFPALYK